jgi:hypothetical protein
MRWMGVLLVGACGFHSHEVGITDSQVASDTSQNASDGAHADGHIDGPPADAQQCFGGGLATVCLTALPASNYDVDQAASTTIASDSQCTQIVAQPGGPALCVVAGVDVHIDGTLDATGARPLVIVATDTLEVSGKIDVSSYRILSGTGALLGEHVGAGEAAANLCSGATAGGDDASGGGGGGAGGSFGGVGGAGAAGRNGAGGTAGAAAAAVTPTFVRGGCAGTAGGRYANNAGGQGAHGGGAVYLIAGTQITITGTVQAGGEGGYAGDIGTGGGGGGAGGLIGLDAPAVTITTGIVYANGGGGAGGGGMNGGGGQGASSMSATMAAKGGSFNTNGGIGGDGSVGTTLGGGDGGTNNNGGGAGGGGAGVIYVHPAQTLAGTVSPPST